MPVFLGREAVCPKEPSIRARLEGEANLCAFQGGSRSKVKQLAAVALSTVYVLQLRRREVGVKKTRLFYRGSEGWVLGLKKGIPFILEMQGAQAKAFASV